ncbi:MAG: LamG-like jellyroll fold domain-containing protein [Victivallales bacterium]
MTKKIFDLKAAKCLVSGLLFCALFLLGPGLKATDYTHTLITYSKANVNLGDAVQDICNGVGITFNTAQTKLNISTSYNQIIFATNNVLDPLIKNATWSEALTTILATQNDSSNPLTYRITGGQVVLNYQKNLPHTATLAMNFFPEGAGSIGPVTGANTTYFTKSTPYATTTSAGTPSKLNKNITATPIAGYHFVNWTGSPNVTFGNAFSSSSSVTLSCPELNGGGYEVNDDATIIAHFGQDDLTNGLVAYYPFNRGNASDESGNGNNGTVYGATLAPNRFGAANSAYYFNGISDYIGCGTNASLDLTAFSISYWVNYSSLPGIGSNSYILSKGGNYASYMDQVPYVYFSEGGNALSTNSKLSSGKWYNIVATYDQNFFKVYVNGKWEANGGLNPVPAGSTDPLFLGASSLGGIVSDYFNGTLDDVRIYNRALAPSEVTELYNSTSAKLTIASSPAAGGTITPSPSVSVNPGDTVQVTAYPKAGYRFSKWIISGASTVDNQYSPNATVTVNASTSLTATFAADKTHNLVSLSYPLKTISLQNAVINCLNKAGLQYDSATSNQNLNISGQPVTTQLIQSDIDINNALWSDALYTILGTGYTFYFQNSKVVLSNVALTSTSSTLVMNFTPTGSGITLPNSGAMTSKETNGELFAIQAIPCPGFHFVNWSGSCGASNTPPVITDVNSAVTTASISNDSTITANFAPNSYEVYSSSTLSGALGTTWTHQITVPAGQALLEVKTSGGTGDCDMTVTDSNGVKYYGVSISNNEDIQIDNPPSGDYTISLYANSAYSGVTMLATCYSAAPLPPESVTASAGTYSNAIVVNWKQSPGATLYEVYRNTENATSGLNFGKIAETADPSYIDTSALVTGNKYYYWVDAKNTDGTSAFSASASGYTLNVPTMPTSVTVSNGTYFDRITVSWPKVVGATSYGLYRSPTQKITAATTSTPCAITVTAHGFNTGDTVMINGISGTMGPLLNGKNFIATVVDPNTFTVPVDTSGKTYTSGGTATAVPLSPVARIDYDSRLTTYSYADTGNNPAPTLASTYYYWVTATNGSGAGPMKLSTTFGSLKKNGPTGVSASKGTYLNQVKITWAAVSGATDYYVYRTANSTPPAAGTQIGTPATTAFYDTPPDGATYYYWVQADYNSAYQSAFGTSSTGYAKTVATAKPTVPVISSASNGAYTNKVVVTWNVSPLAASYNIYRKALSAALWDPPVNVGNVLTYDDITAPGIKYTYSVSAVNGAGESALSASKTGYAAGAVAPGLTSGTQVDIPAGGAKGNEQLFSIVVPAGCTRLVAKAESVTPIVAPLGSCDIYAKLGPTYPTTTLYTAKGALISGTKADKSLTVTKPAAGTWFFLLYGSGTNGYSSAKLTVTFYYATNILLTQVPADDQPAPFTATFKGQLVDESNTGLSGFYIGVRNPSTGLETWLTAKTDSKGNFTYSTTIPCEGEFTYDFFITSIPDNTTSIGSWTVATAKSAAEPGGYFDFAGYLRGTIVPAASMDALAGMQDYMNLRRGFVDVPSDMVNSNDLTTYEPVWVDDTIGNAASDAAITTKLDSGLYLLLYGVEGAAVGNGKTTGFGLTATPLLIHVTSAMQATVLANLLSAGLVDNTFVTDVTTGGKIGVVPVTVISNPSEDPVTGGYSVWLMAQEQFELLADLAGNSNITNVGIYSGSEKQCTVTLQSSLRELNIVTDSFTQ